MKMYHHDQISHPQALPRRMDSACSLHWLQALSRCTDSACSLHSPRCAYLPTAGSINRWAALLALFLFLMGISLGAFLEIYLSAEVREGLWDFLNGGLVQENTAGSFCTLFLESLGKNLPLFLVAALAPLTVIGFPASVLTLLIKGISLGFSAALLFQNSGLRGLLLVMASLLPQNLFLLPCFYITAVLAIQLAVCVAASPSSIGACLMQQILPFLRKQLKLLPFLLLGCLLEAFTGPTLVATLTTFQ